VIRRSAGAGHGACAGALAPTQATRRGQGGSGRGQIDLSEVKADVAAQGAALAPVRIGVDGIKAAIGSSPARDFLEAMA
jgi:hypothetical protein